MHHCLVLKHFMCTKTDYSEIHSDNTTLSFSSYEICCDILYISGSQPPSGTGPWHQLYRAASDSHGIDN